MNQPDPYLLDLLARDTWTEEECRWLLHYLEHTPGTELRGYLLERFRRQGITVPDSALQARLLDRIHERIRPQGETPVVPLRRRPWKTAAAAAVIAAIAGGAWFFTQPSGKQPQQLAKQATPADRKDVLPGGNKARLVLANGRTVSLEQAAEGRISGDGERVNKEDDGLVYEPSTHSGINKLITPNGGQYRVQLADGTIVWLNAASCLQYPASFNGSDRTVALTGEAYFEVAQDASKPFFVKVNGMTVQVLGTSFNVNAYPEEKSFTTTLLQGAVRVVAGKRQTTLAPGEQSVLEQHSGSLRRAAADTEDAVAWKNGILTFRNDELAAVMRDISRWYDVEIIYAAGIDEKIHVTGAMRKQEQLSQALKILELTAELHFSVQGRTVTVSK
ncbi:FecR family protein [Chitinophaga cymbidii]|uniref:FecR family protein n=1 Tax=Chitinophaga cymbidii TaxID=1096750 RepID=UPI0011BF1CBC|nr:FecR family protein [Chitinophaga cymbidii]